MKADERDETAFILKRHEMEIQKLQTVLSMTLKEVDRLHHKIVLLSIDQKERE